MTQPTILFLLVERALGEPLLPFVSKHRKDERTWPYIARLISKRIEVEISDESLRRWYVKHEPAKARAA